MKRMPNRKTILAVAALIAGSLVSFRAAAQADCSAEIAEIDRRIAAGDYAEINSKCAGANLRARSRASG
jgi:hypothetical protein